MWCLTCNIRKHFHPWVSTSDRWRPLRCLQNVCYVFGEWTKNKRSVSSAKKKMRGQELHINFPFWEINMINCQSEKPNSHPLALVGDSSHHHQYWWYFLSHSMDSNHCTNGPLAELKKIRYTIIIREGATQTSTGGSYNRGSAQKQNIYTQRTHWAIKQATSHPRNMRISAVPILACRLAVYIYQSKPVWV